MAKRANSRNRECMMKRKVLETSRLVAILLVVAVAQTWAQEYQITRWTVDGGGTVNSTGGAFELSGTIGQPDAGVMLSSDGTFELTGGFWFEEPPGDCNSTGGVNLLDYDDFVPCLSGPDAGVALGCECFDMDVSGTVDLLDFAVAQANFTGS